jgi:hypothetical protein
MSTILENSSAKWETIIFNQSNSVNLQDKI